LAHRTIRVPRGGRILFAMYFEIIGEVRQPETIAAGAGVRARKRLSRAYGRGRWRKRKGFARVRLLTGDVREAEVHWYEASGIGRRELKIKRFLHPSNEP
jgi:hypothetical protein